MITWVDTFDLTHAEKVIKLKALINGGLRKNLSYKDCNEIYLKFRRRALLLFLLLLCKGLGAQFRISTCKDFKPLTHDDSVFIYKAVDEDEVKKCFVFKLSERDMIITYKIEDYDLVLMVRDRLVYSACEYRKNEFIIYDENDKD